MADLSSYTPIYIRTSGDDATGDGSLAAPFATAQKGFQAAYLGTGNFVLDLGEGSFGGVNANELRIEIWPSRIAVRGVSAAVSNLGGIVFTFGDWTAGGPYGTVSIIGNKTVNLGNINTGTYVGISLEDCVAEIISPIAAAVTLVNCSVGDIVDIINQFAYGSNVSLINSTAGNIYLVNIFGGSAYFQYSSAGSVDVGTTEPEFGSSGTITGTGYWNSVYHIDSTETTLPQSGTGVWNDKQYFSGVLAVGWIAPNYYTNGELSKTFSYINTNSGQFWGTLANWSTLPSGSGVSPIDVPWVDSSTIALNLTLAPNAAVPKLSGLLVGMNGTISGRCDDRIAREIISNGHNILNHLIYYNNQ